jgi:hypothetical protein
MPPTSDADVDTRSQLEARKRTLLSNVERALLDALAESPDVHRSIWRLQKAGFTLRLSIECHGAPGDDGGPRISDVGHLPHRRRGSRLPALDRHRSHPPHPAAPPRVSGSIPEPQPAPTEILGLPLPRLAAALEPWIDRPFRARQIFVALHRRRVAISG